MSPREDLGNSVRQKSRVFRPPRGWENSARQKSRVFCPPREDGPGKILSPQNHVPCSRQATEAWLPTRQCELQDNASSLAYTPALDGPLRVFFSPCEKAANENGENSVPKKTRHFQPLAPESRQNSVSKKKTFHPPAQGTGKCKCLALYTSSSLRALNSMT